MIGSTTSLPYVDSLRKALESGTATAGKIQVINATPEVQAQLDSSYSATQSAVAQLTATAKANPTWASFDPASNAVTLPDVGSLSKSDAAHVQQGLQYLMDIGRLDGKTIIAKNGDQSTDSTAVYQGWLQARVGVDVHI